jgi:hypothetical protein
MPPPAPRRPSSPRGRSTLCFADDFTAKVFQAEPYASDTGREKFNQNDSLYSRDLELTLSDEDGSYLGLITLDVATA